jgi:hypothetical protein
MPEVNSVDAYPETTTAARERSAEEWAGAVLENTPLGHRARWLWRLPPIRGPNQPVVLAVRHVVTDADGDSCADATRWCLNLIHPRRGCDDSIHHVLEKV